MSTKKNITPSYINSVFAEKNDISHDFFDNLTIRTDKDINQNEKIINFYQKKLIKSAVLVPIVFDEGQCSILLTYRSAKLKDHANQISFPGGRIDQDDISPVHTAIRETFEEIGIDKKYINIIGNLDAYVTGTGFQILPIISVIAKDYTTDINSNEVDSIFKLPLDFLMDNNNHEVDNKLYDNGNTSYNYNFKFHSFFSR